MHRFFTSEFFNFEFLRVLSTAPNGGCDIAEALEAASRIKDGDPESWSRAWADAAAHANAFADEAASTGDVVAARRAYLRASNYYRASQYMLSDRPGARDERVLPRYEKCLELFKKGVALQDEVDVIFLHVPYEGGIDFSAYLYLPKQTYRLPGKTPLVINVNGGDSIQEELYFLCPSAGPRLGYAVLTFDGPGQGLALRKSNVPMRPDYEIATTKVLDMLEKEADPSWNLDLDKVAVVGASMGGYYALRAAADPRFKACLAIDPPYDMWELIASKLPAWFLNGWSGGWLTDGFVDTLIGLVSKVNFQLKWEVGQMMWAFGVDSPASALKSLKTFTLRLPNSEGSEYVRRIKCPVMVTGAAASLYFRPELSCQRIYDALTHLPEEHKKCWIANEAADGGLQAKIGAFQRSNQKTFEWLDHVFKIQRNNL